MSTSVDEFDFSGSAGAEVAAEASAGGAFAKEIEFLSLDGSPAGKAQGKDKILLRFVTNMIAPPPGTATKFNLGWLTVQGHYAPTKPKPEYAREGATWPSKMGCGCRKDKIFKVKYNDSCPVCAQGSKPSNRTWALAIEREEVRDDNTGQVLGYQDKTREIMDTDENGEFIVTGVKQDGKKEYQKKIVPAYIVCSMGWRNFYQPLQAAAQYHQGLLNAEWLITRTGTDNNDTTYFPIQVGAGQMIPEGYMGLSARPFDLADQEVITTLYPDLPDLRKTLVERVSQDYLGRFFIPGWEPEGWQEEKAKREAEKANGGGSNLAKPPTAGMMMMSTGSAAPAPGTPDVKGTEEPSSSALDALKNRVTQQGGAPAAEETPASS